ncbi:hypothetical protein [Sphingomonas montana]|uniref:hypothetical protein n=1 Tax=Sphingomonas montana TaxID=1843236 RepID=UPI00096E651E|nr:hypothetical protein [Sphingomonas montana]
MKTAWRIVGVAAVLIGALWILQGLGVVRWPASSFMLDARPWAVRGAVMVAMGCMALWMGARARG